MIFLSLRFYVKSILMSLELLKIPICHLCGSEICQFGKFLWKMQKFITVTIHSLLYFEAADFAHLKLQKLISRKI